MEPIETLPFSADALDRIASGEPYITVTSLGGAHRIDIIDSERAALRRHRGGSRPTGAGAVRHRPRGRTASRSMRGGSSSPGGETPLPAMTARDLTRSRAATGSAGSARGGAASPLRCAAQGRVRSELDPRDGHQQRLRHGETVIEVALRHPTGLLQDIGGTSPGRRCRVRSAQSVAYAGQTLDTFYVTEFGGGQLAPGRTAQAVAMIINTCDAD